VRKKNLGELNPNTVDTKLRNSMIMAILIILEDGAMRNTKSL
jgi:hypothetical protein